MPSRPLGLNAGVAHSARSIFVLFYFVRSVFCLVLGEVPPSSRRGTGIPVFRDTVLIKFRPFSYFYLHMWDFLCIFAPDFQDVRTLSEDKQQGK